MEENTSTLDIRAINENRKRERIDPDNGNE
jgi:hypothetical protein